MKIVHRYQYYNLIKKKINPVFFKGPIALIHSCDSCPSTMGNEYVQVSKKSNWASADQGFVTILDDSGHYYHNFFQDKRFSWRPFSD
jgi:hypothetical protein